MAFNQRLAEQRAAEMYMVAQMREQITFVSTVTERCFQDCVTSFRSKDLTPQEETCVKRCTDKYVTFYMMAAQNYAAEMQESMSQMQ